MDKWAKVVRFHNLLRQSRFCVPTDKVLSELECPKSTFHRILKFLRYELHAPVEFDRTHGGYKYEYAEGEEEFELPGLWFNKGELEALLCLDSALDGLQHNFYGGLLSPLRARLKPLLKAQKVRIEDLHRRIRFVPIHARPVSDIVFQAIAGAAVHGKNVRILHAKFEDQKLVDRVISPQTLLRYRDNWYVDAFCHIRNDLRTFALNRISKAEVVRGNFHRVPPKKLKEHFESAYGIYAGPATNIAEILFHGVAAREVAQEAWHPDQKGGWLPGGTYQLQIPYGNDRELLMDVFRWGCEAEIRNPPELRDKAKLLLINALQQYNP